jgi:hypothetical protein
MILDSKLKILPQHRIILELLNKHKDLPRLVKTIPYWKLKNCLALYRRYYRVLKQQNLVWPYFKRSLTDKYLNEGYDKKGISTCIKYVYEYLNEVRRNNHIMDDEDFDAVFSLFYSYWLKGLDPKEAMLKHRVLIKVQDPLQHCLIHTYHRQIDFLRKSIKTCHKCLELNLQASYQHCGKFDYLPCLIDARLNKIELHIVRYPTSPLNSSDSTWLSLQAEQFGFEL